MRIGIIKIGQKIIFDRKSEGVQRSNKNGNVDLYKTVMLLANNNPNDSFCLLSGSDAEDYEGDIPSNIIYDSFTINSQGEVDALIVFAGMVLSVESYGYINYINQFTGKIVLLAHDPRCLKDTLENLIPGKIKTVLSQKRESIIVGRQEVNCIDAGLERAICYNETVSNFNLYTKNICIIAAPSPGYDKRKESILEFLSDTNKVVSVCGGCLTDKDVEEYGLNNVIIHGDFSYNALSVILQGFKNTLVIPIESGWHTTKYLESLLNGVVPIIHKDYGDFEYLSEYFPHYIPSVGIVYPEVSKDYLIDKFVKPYIDGKVVSKIIMNPLKEDI